MAVDLPFPPRYVVSYINDKLLEFGIISDGEVVPIVATAPSNTDEIWDQLINSNQTTPLLIQYDRLMRFRANPFYQIKKEQVALYLYGDLRVVNDAVITIQSLLDREDAAAEDLNRWAYNKSFLPSPTSNTYEDQDPNKRLINFGGTQNFTHNINFHNFMIYQVDESRDVTELASARAIYVNKIIIEYTYNVRDRSVKDGTGNIIR